MEILAAILIVIGLFASFHKEVPPPKGEINLATGSGAAVRVRSRVRPLSEIEKTRVVKQNYDYSCGSAALATLLNYDLGEDFTERQVIHGLLRYGDAKKIAERRAFSLLDMKKFVGVLGYKGVGYKATIDDLKTLGRPCIIPITVYQYRHFVVFKGIYDGHVFVADPWRGNMSYTISVFKHIWYKNVIFVVYPNGAREIHALRLTEQDLRYIDEDTAKDIMLDHGQPVSVPVSRSVDEIPGKYQWYKK